MVQYAGVQYRYPVKRMVREKPDRTEKKKKDVKQPNTSPDPDEPATPQQVQRSGQKNQDATEGRPDALHCSHLHSLHSVHLSDEQLETWSKRGPEAANLPTHLRPFSSPEEYKLVKRTHQELQHSSYYWGAMTMEEAHRILTLASPGTFLIRDSGQPDVFFTLSYHSDDGPMSIRVVLRKLLFSLCGSQKTFPSLFDLLAHYSGPSCKLTTPYRRQRPESLMQICRRALVRTYGAENIRNLTGLSSEVKDYIHAYPHAI